MPSRYTVITKKDGDWWIGWVEEVPGVNAQERTKKELLASLRIALREATHLERKNRRSNPQPRKRGRQEKGTVPLPQFDLRGLSPFPAQRSRPPAIGGDMLPGGQAGSLSHCGCRGIQPS